MHTLSRRAVIIGIVIIAGFLAVRTMSPVEVRIAALPPLYAVQPPPDSLGIIDQIARPGDVLKRIADGQLYYVDTTQHRWVFTTVETFQSWYPSEQKLKILEEKKLIQIPLFRNVTIRPGTFIVHFDTDPAYYVVAHGGALRRTSEALLSDLYGASWRTRLVTVPEYYRVDYHIASDVTSVDDFDPLKEYQSSPTISVDHAVKGS